MSKIRWTELAPGVWETKLGKPEGLTPLGIAGAAPKLEAIGRLGSGTLPFELDSILVEQQSDRWVLSIPLQASEKLYGTGLQFMRMNQRGRSRFLRVNSDPKQDTGETHAPVPLYISDLGYGLLVDSARIITMHLGSTVKRERSAASEHPAARDRNTDPAWKATPDSDQVDVILPREGARVVLFGGNQLDEIVQKYNLLCGGGVLPPKWGLGFWHRVPSLYTDQEVIQEAMEFRSKGFPCDVIGLEPGWHSRSYPVTYEWDQARFPKPEAFLCTLRELGLRVNLWEHPYISPESELYATMLPLSGTHTVWGGLAPDYTLAEAQEAYIRQHEREHVEIGVAGYKLDECDGSELTKYSWMFPAHASFPSGYDGEQMRQMYGLLFQRMTQDLYKRRNLRTYGLVRASGAGASSMPSVLYSDLYDHRQFVRALCNASFCGLLWTPEVRKADHDEDWVRRMQTVCFSPLAMLNAWGDGTKPWSYPEVAEIIRHYMRLRISLLPYLYTLFAIYRDEGMPPIRAMPLALSRYKEGTDQLLPDPSNPPLFNTSDAAYGSIRSDREWDDQYMLGEDLLVAPLFAGDTGRDVLLPPGVWYGLENGQRYEGGRVIQVESVLEQIPVFVREGAVLPMIPPMDRIPTSSQPTALHLVHFGQAPGECRLYDDDGESLGYEQGDFEWWHFKVSKSPEGKLAGVMHGANQTPASYERIHWHLGQAKLPEELLE